MFIGVLSLSFVRNFISFGIFFFGMGFVVLMFIVGRVLFLIGIMFMMIFFGLVIF